MKYARSSLQEVRTRLPDGVAKGHYLQTDIDDLLKLAERLERVLGGLYFSLRRQAEAKRRSARPDQRPPRGARRRRRRDEE
ncbi:MAG TPA: hypothetical protein VMN81_13530 [Vicinamibacterales bacterium]|nr:hypothetical protein [Vicinamibacterales bacterium]